MRTVCIVQARMGSKRLPGKVLLPLNGHTVIAEILLRCGRIPGVDQIVCAIPNTFSNDKLGHEAASFADVYYGGEDDVLARYRHAAVETKADVIVRITGDCPLISPELCGDVIALRAKQNVEYASNIEPRTFPQGYDCEVFTANLLRDADRYARGDEREHVTTWMRKIDIKRANLKSKWPLEGRLTLDTEDDYRTICAYFGHKPYESGQHIRAA